MTYLNKTKKNHLISPHQSGFIPGDSCVQYIYIYIYIYRCLFLDISKAFDKVWHDGLLYKLKRNGINDGLLKPVERFLSDRHQGVVLNGQTSKWIKITAGVPQGSNLRPLFFLIYINDLPSELSCSPKLFVDDT